MIVTGYIEQFYEVTDIFAFAVWGAISTVFFHSYPLVDEKSHQRGQGGNSGSGSKKLKQYLDTISDFLDAVPGSVFNAPLGRDRRSFFQ